MDRPVLYYLFTHLDVRSIELAIDYFFENWSDFDQILIEHGDAVSLAACAINRGSGRDDVLTLLTAHGCSVPEALLVFRMSEIQLAKLHLQKGWTEDAIAEDFTRRGHPGVRIAAILNAAKKFFRQSIE